jgi:hypothetical protein
LARAKTNFFGQRGFKVQEDGWEDNIHAVLDTLGDFIKEGKIILDFLTKRHGVSCVFEESKHHHLPRIKQFKTHILY